VERSLVVLDDAAQHDAVAAEVAALVDAGETVFRVVAADGSNSRTESSSPTMFVPSH
jgi:hypothetical protein